MKFDAKTQDEFLIVTPQIERLDALRAPAFREQMLALVKDNKRVILSFSEIEFMDSSGLGSIVAVMKAVTGGGELRVAAMNGMVRNIFRLTRLDRIFHIYETVEQATEQTRISKAA